MPFKNDIHDNQTAILRWLKSRGHREAGLGEADEAGYHQRRSCSAKRRFPDAASAQAEQPNMNVYACRYCHGFHLATPRERSHD